MPLFWPANPQIWFVQAEEQFSRWGITASKTKYEEIVCALPTEYATKVHDFLLDPSEDDPYKNLKDQLILRIADSEHQKIWQLLTVEELRDCKPTQLIHKMQQLLGAKAFMDSSLLRELFLQRLPSNVQMILATTNEMTIDRLADRIMDMATPTVTVVSVSTGNNAIWPQ